METPVQRAFNRYQMLWSDVWQNIATYILTENQIKNTEVDSSTDALVGVDMAAMEQATNSLGNLTDRTLLDPNVSSEAASALLRVILQGVGVADIEEIFDAKSDTPVDGDTDKDDTTVPPNGKSENGASAEEILAWLKQYKP
jgi:hypothetical protein